MDDVCCFFVRERVMHLGTWYFVSHLNHSNRSVRQLFTHLDYNLTVRIPVCSSIPCFDTELTRPPFHVSSTYMHFFFYQTLLAPSCLTA